MARAEAVETRKRVYWKSSDGMLHGLVMKENGSECEVYCYSTGDTLSVKYKDIEKTITEANE